MVTKRLTFLSVTQNLKSNVSWSSGILSLRMNDENIFLFIDTYVLKVITISETLEKHGAKCPGTMLLEKKNNNNQKLQHLKNSTASNICAKFERPSSKTDEPPTVHAV